MRGSIEKNVLWWVSWPVHPKRCWNDASTIWPTAEAVQSPLSPCWRRQSDVAPAIELLINLRTGLLTDHKDLQGIGKEDENEGEERLLTSGFGLKVPDKRITPCSPGVCTKNCVGLQSTTEWCMMRLETLGRKHSSTSPLAEEERWVGSKFDPDSHVFLLFLDHISLKTGHHFVITSFITKLIGKKILVRNKTSSANGLHKHKYPHFFWGNLANLKALKINTNVYPPEIIPKPRKEKPNY